MNWGMPITERFWLKVDKNGPVPSHCPELGNCWEWTGFCYPTGHGQFFIEGRRNIKAARAAWLLFIGDPGSNYVCHHCDNPKCVRLEHLYLGTHQTNMQDRTRRTQWQKTKRKQTKLTWALVREIRALVRTLPKVRNGKRYERIAQMYSVSVHTIGRLMRACKLESRG